MSDDEVRELERRWHASGSDSDEAAYLVARLRAGTLERAQVELLARLGHTAAVLVTGVRAAPRPTTLNELEGWLREALVPGGLPALVRGALVVLIDFCRELAELRGMDPTGRRRQVVAALRPVIDSSEDWCLCPCAAHLRRAADAATRAEEATANDGRVSVLVDLGLAVARGIVEHEAPLASANDRAQAIDALVDVCLHQVEPGRPPVGLITERIRLELRGWLLDAVDPIAERVRARRG